MTIGAIWSIVLCVTPAIPTVIPTAMSLRVQVKKSGVPPIEIVHVDDSRNASTAASSLACSALVRFENGRFKFCRNRVVVLLIPYQYLNLT